MTNLMVFRVKGRTNFTGAIVECEADPYPQFKVSVHKNGRKYLREPNYHERKRLHKYAEEYKKECIEKVKKELRPNYKDVADDW